MVKIFCSYSHADEQFRTLLEAHIKILKRKNLIDFWRDRDICVGTNIDDAIDAHIKSADIVIILVSTDFLASDYCYDTELKIALERHHRGECRLIPVIVRPCEWHDSHFGRLLAAPTDGLPVSKWPDRDEAFVDISRHLQVAIKEISDHKNKKNNVRTYRSDDKFEWPDVWKVRSFLRNSMEYINRYFLSSIDKLKPGDQDIEIKAVQVDENRFFCCAYRHGMPIADVMVWPDDLQIKALIAGETICLRVIFKENRMTFSCDRFDNASHLNVDDAAQLLWRCFSKHTDFF